jgi:hypothetical protein
MMRKVLFLFFSLLLAGGMSFAQIVVSGDITTNTTWTSNNTYMLRDIVRVQTGATLTIEPGTIIYGENSTQGSLVVKPGGKLMAEGTLNNPIVFTSEFNKPGSMQTPNYGDWGGIILLGNAPINVPGGVASIEGPGDQYGGTDAEDNSGVMKYVRIEYPGIAYSPNNEINGLTFGGVGRGTTIDYIQVSYSGDDSYEWFGGTVNCKHLIAYRGWDDEFDTDFGYSGKLQFLVGLRDPEVADQSGSNGFESDNDGSGSTNSPRTSPTWWNVTMVGPLATTTTPINSLFKRGMHLRRSSQNKVNNALLMGWPLGILIDGVNTTTDAQNGVMYVKNSIVSGNTGSVIDSTSSNGTFNPTTFFSSNNNRSFVTNAEVSLVAPFDLNNPNFFPQVGSPLLTGAGTPPNDGFFDATATFVGAFGSDDWTFGWARFKPEITTDVEEIKISNTIPDGYNLSQNFPNPFNPTTRISFSVVEPTNIKLTVYNILGQQVSVLVNDFKTTGSYEVNFDASSLSSGIYIYSLEAGSIVVSKKMTLLK